jgi:hypothetical protein
MIAARQPERRHPGGVGRAWADLLPEAVAHLGDLVSDNPGQADRVREIRSLTDQRGVVLAALVANVQANRPPQSGSSCSTATSRSPTR